MTSEELETLRLIEEDLFDDTGAPPRLMAADLGRGWTADLESLWRTRYKRCPDCDCWIPNDHWRTFCPFCNTA